MDQWASRRMVYRVKIFRRAVTLAGRRRWTAKPALPQFRSLWLGAQASVRATGGRGALGSIR